MLYMTIVHIQIYMTDVSMFQAERLNLIVTDTLQNETDRHTHVS